MPLSERKAKENYRNSIQDHIQGYRNASNANSISDAAQALESEFGTGDSLTVDTMVSNWAEKY